MKKRKIGLYNPYLDSVGGGERHVLSILQVLEQEGFDPVIFWDSPSIVQEIKKRLNLSFSNLSIQPNIFTSGSIIHKLSALTDFDIFIYVTDGSYFFSTAKKTYVFCMVPNPHLFAKTAVNWLKTRNFDFITNSEFTQRNLSKWGIQSTVLYPYISDEFFQIGTQKKEDYILVTGRFFGHLHSKRQDIAIEAFNQLQENAQFKNYRLILAGSVLDSDLPYFTHISEMAHNNPSIEIKKNISFTELVSLYEKAKFYWHFTGYGVDENTEPEKVEHLGITPLEAMAAGCTVFGYNAGGLKEIIKDGDNGFLFDSKEDLITKITTVSEEHCLQIGVNAQHFVKASFSYDHFRNQVLELFLNK